MRASGASFGSLRNKRLRLLAASSYLCLALMLNKPSPVLAADLASPAIITKAPPAFQDRWFVSVEGGYLFNSSQKNLSFDPTDPFLGSLPPVSPGRNGGTFGFMVGRTLGPQWDLAFGYNATLLGTARSNVTKNLPLNIGGTFNNLSASASSSMWYQTFDAEVGYRPPAWQAANVRVFFGPRVLTAQSQINYQYNNLSNSALGTFDKLGNFDHEIDLAGVGPRAGLEASVPLSFVTAPLSFDVSGSGSAIFTRVTDNYAFSYSLPTPIGTTAGAGSSAVKTSPTIYDLEAKAGFGYHINGSATIEAGYQVQQWYNLATSIALANDVGGFQEGRGNVLVHGPFAKITVALP